MEKQIRNLRIGLIAIALYSVLITVVLAIIYNKTSKSETQSEIIRTKGIIIEDAGGRERILIGAPIPEATGRVRTDSAKVRELWASRFRPKEDWFMDKYNTYNHSTNGILLLDENGHDRMAIGDPVPELWFGKRIGASTGMIINDSTGLERTGYGLLNLEGVYRVNLGFDYPGKEGMMLGLDDAGVVGISIRDAHNSIFVGKADTATWQTDNIAPFNGIIVKDSVGMKYKLNSWDESKIDENNE